MYISVRWVDKNGDSNLIICCYCNQNLFLSITSELILFSTIGTLQAQNTVMIISLHIDNGLA